MKKIFNKALRILLTTNGMLLLAGAMLGPIYALFVEEIGGDLLDASLAGAMFAAAAGVTVLISGKYADKIKEGKTIVVIGYGLIGIGFLLLTQVHTMWTLLLVQVIIGIGEAIYSPAFDALYSRHLDKNKFGREWGAWEALMYFSTAAGAIIGGIVVTMFGFTILFVIMGVLSLLSALYIYLLPKKLL
ncbi:MFS transporter [Candidatus Kuenenbacteria bacterium]|nr:MFS transporter [Candidatus Kuenenbacteria bacterium]